MPCSNFHDVDLFTVSSVMALPLDGFTPFRLVLIFEEIERGSQISDVAVKASFN